MIYKDSNGKICRKKSDIVDFVFVYEVKNREVQAISIIGYELIKRGYTVEYVSAWHELHRSGHRVKAKVAILFEGYNDNVIKFALSFIERCDKAFNMQWEQLLSPRCLESDSIYYLKGSAKCIYHCSWGEKNHRHLVDVCGIPEEKIVLAGHVGHDFLRPQLKGYYRTRESIFKEFGLDTNRRVILFIASFPPMIQKEGLSMATNESRRVGQESRVKVIEWFKRYQKENSGCTIIYRPHPTEHLTDEFIQDLASDGDIRIISDYSIQQWIDIVDDILVWRSTSMADIYMAHKGCLYLNPVELPKRFEYFMMNNARRVTSYEEFTDGLNGDYQFPISDEVMNDYYLIDDTPVYVKIVDKLVKIYEDDSVELDDSFFRERTEKGNRTIHDLRNLYGFYKAKILYKTGIEKDGHAYEAALYDRNADKKNYTSEKEIVMMMNRLDSILNGVKRNN